MYKYSENDVEPGWRPVVKAAIEAVERLGGTILQVKEKFGGLRIYYHANGNNSDDMDAIVKNAEFLCSEMCEFCGEPAKPITINGWVKTCCRKCEAKIVLDKM